MSRKELKAFVYKARFFKHAQGDRESDIAFNLSKQSLVEELSN